MQRSFFLGVVENLREYVRILRMYTLWGTMESLVFGPDVSSCFPYEHRARTGMVSLICCNNNITYSYYISIYIKSNKKQLQIVGYVIVAARTPIIKHFSACHSQSREGVIDFHAETMAQQLLNIRNRN